MFIELIIYKLEVKCKRFNGILGKIIGNIKLP